MNAEKLSIEKIFPARKGKNKAFSCLQVRSSVSSQDGRSSDVKSILLGGNFEKKGKVSFETVANATIKKFDLKEGDDLGQAIKRGLRITVTEKEDDGQENLGFQAKVNPSTGQILTKGGKDILRKTEVTGLDRADSLVQSDGVREGVKADAEAVEAELSA